MIQGYRFHIYKHLLWSKLRVWEGFMLQNVWRTMFMEYCCFHIISRAIMTQFDRKPRINYSLDKFKTLS